MYRRRRRFGIVRVILIGISIGILFLLYDYWRAEPTPASQPPGQVTVVPTVVVSGGDSETTLPLELTVAPGASSDPNVITDASIFIPAAGIFAPVIRVYLDGVSWNVDNLGTNVGHLEGTAWMGSGTGNIVLSGHVEMRDGSAGVFASIDDLNAGDLIVLTEGTEARNYAVTEVYTVAPDDLSPVYPSTTDRLTLITCDGYDFLRNAYTERVIVVAERIG
jgi:LPXTG-site transpeptidase (sortase) family protein